MRFPKWPLFGALFLSLLILSHSAFADDTCSDQSKSRIWIPTESIAASSEWSKQRATYPIVIFNGKAVDPKVATPLMFAMVGAFHQLGANVDKDVFTVNIKEEAPLSALDKLFQPYVNTIIFVLDRPDGATISARNREWLTSVVHAMDLPESIGTQLFLMSEANCLRGAMLFHQKGPNILSLFIWNSVAIDDHETSFTACLVEAFITKTDMNWSTGDRFGRHFLRAC